MKIENIKFKAKRLDNGEWVKGDLVHSTSYVGISYDWFRSQYFGYMYIDDDFFKAIDRAKGKCIEDVKGEREVAPLFVMYKNGDMYVTDFFDFFDDGSPGTNSVCFS